VLGAAPGVAVAGGLVVFVEGVSTGGVEGSAGAALDELGFDDEEVEEVSALVLVLEPPVASGEERTSEPAVLVAAALAAEPVEAIWPDHQSLLARCFGEALR